ncbi:AAA family ATPase [Actinoplanes sp. NPDC026619]|uniref:AAA family ATPase n=1 Tax=Actinoplanes sp. NPDC026619 TaxID=3155798 RepID=UPI0033D7A177
MTTTGPTLVIIRGNSASGKSTVAKEVRRRFGRGAALIEQDYLRREMLREHGSTSTPTTAPGFITTMARTALAAGYHVVLEGSLHTGQYGTPLLQLIADHPGPSHVFWMDVGFDETLRWHAGRSELAHVTAEMMRTWYAELDLLGVPSEQVIPEESSVEDTVAAILHDSGLAEAAALSPCPLVCRRCVQKREQAPAGAGDIAKRAAVVTRPDRSDARGLSNGPAADENAGIWAAIAASRAWLDEHNGDAEPELGLRILKIVEEAGEAAAAWIGTLGQNPRKGVTHSRHDVADELGDVAFTALVAAASLGYDPREVLAQVAAKVRPRLTSPPPPGPQRAAAAGSTSGSGEQGD